jgi:hypothetical protein
MAAERGISVRQLRRQLAEDRCIRERMEREKEERAEYETRGRFDYPYMALDAPGIRSSGYATCTSEGWSNRDSGKYHVGGNVKSLGSGRQAKDEDLTDDLTNATSYVPDPDGLKGGVG